MRNLDTKNNYKVHGVSYDLNSTVHFENVLYSEQLSLMGLMHGAEPKRLRSHCFSNDLKL